MRKIIISFYVLYVFIITYLSLTPIEHKIPENIWDWDKASHFTAYLLLAIFVKKVHIRFSYLTSVITCFSYSFAIECIQYFIPNRQFDVLDMLANLLGTVLGTMIYYLISEKCFNNCRGVAVKEDNK